ncbi:MAG: hypothetical protein HY286_20245 [Planctomycetes bacterium]|nr:hypothetical protein [Planctomycetota bacterium]
MIDRLGFVVPNRRIFIYGDEAFNRFYWESDRGLLRTNAEGDGMFILPQGNYRLRVARHGHDYSGGGCNSTHFCDAFPCAATPDRFITIRAGETSFLDDTCPALVAPKFCLSTNGVERHETHVELAMSADYNKSEFRWNWGNNDSIKIEEGNYDVILYDSPAEGIALNFRANDVSLLSGCPYFSFDLRCGKVRIAPGSLGKFVRGEQIQLFWNSGARSCTLTMVAPNTDEFEIPFAPEGTSRIVVYRGGVQSTVFATVRPNELINVSF